ncbi:MULE domain-containing protein, partial [Aphis craccivora]
MGRHPNIWDFLRKLTYIENQFSVEFNQVWNNLRERDGISRSERVIATHILLLKMSNALMNKTSCFFAEYRSS